MQISRVSSTQEIEQKQLSAFGLWCGETMNPMMSGLEGKEEVRKI